MEASEMLDVLHALFEDDVTPTWEQDSEIKDKVRQSIYKTMYGRNYKYGASSEQGRNSEWEFGGTPTAAPMPTDSIYTEPTDGSIKPFIPPTDDGELFDIVGPPLGE